MKLTNQQENLINFGLENSGNCIGRARAGTAKTTTGRLAAVAYNQKFPLDEISGMAFNRSIAKTLAEQIPFANIKTANGFGYGAWMKRCGKKISKVNTYKNREIIKEINSEDTFSDLAKAISICKAWGLVPTGTLAEPTVYFPDEVESYKFLFDNYNIDTEDSVDPIGLTREALSRGITRGWRGDIDFDDQIYLSTIYKAPLPKCHFLILDETQDLNPIQRYMAKLMLHPSGRIMAFGDDCQAIYGFRGADRESIDNLIEEFSCEILPLTISFRCPREVVLHAQQFVPDIEPYEHAKDGEVRELGPNDKLIPEIESIGGKMIILCRNNAPLVKAALSLIKNNIGAVILGRDLEKGLIYLIDKQKASHLTDLKSKLWNFIAQQQDHLISRGATKQAQLMEDKGECLEILITNEMNEGGNVYGLKQRIKSIFSDKSGTHPVTLSTIHKAKGLEFPTVFILDPDLMPSKFAKTPAEIRQENNLHYVGITRSQDKLIYTTSENI